MPLDAGRTLLSDLEGLNAPDAMVRGHMGDEQSFVSALSMLLACLGFSAVRASPSHVAWARGAQPGVDSLSLFHR